MATFFYIALAGVAWMALRADLDWLTFATGAAIGVAAWRIEGASARRPFSLARAVRMVPAAIHLLGLFLWELVVANVEQLRVVLAPRIRVRPHWIHFRTEIESPAMRATLGLMIALTPGTITAEEVELDDGGFSIGLHVLDAAEAEQAVERIRRRLEAPLRRLELL